MFETICILTLNVLEEITDAPETDQISGGIADR